jgi:hypothetical protein
MGCMLVPHISRSQIVSPLCSIALCLLRLELIRPSASLSSCVTDSQAETAHMYSTGMTQTAKVGFD